MRARSIKPGFYKNEELTECSPWARLLFPGLWMMADREGKLENRPKRIKNELFPSDSLDVSALLCELEAHGLIKTYTVNGYAYIWIIKFCEHQRPHQNEVASVIPNYSSTDEVLAPMVEGLATKVESASLLITSSLIPESTLNPPTPPGGGAKVSKPKRERKPRSSISIPFADDFATFWQAYPRKVARPNAERAWTKLVKAGELPDIDILLAAVANQTDAKDWYTDQQFCPHPATWLNGKRWEDAIFPSGKTQDARWHKYRTWVSRYDEKRRKWHPDAPQLTSGEIDEAARVVDEYIAPDSYTEELLGLGIEWLLQAPERCAFVPTLKSLGDFASPAWGSIAGWACNAVRGVKVTATPYETGV